MTHGCCPGSQAHPSMNHLCMWALGMIHSWRCLHVSVNKDSFLLNSHLPSSPHLLRPRQTEESKPGVFHLFKEHCFPSPLNQLPRGKFWVCLSLSTYQVLHIALRAEDKMMKKPPSVRHLPHKHKNLSSNPRKKKNYVWQCTSVSPVLGMQRQGDSWPNGLDARETLSLKVSGGPLRKKPNLGLWPTHLYTCRCTLTHMCTYM